MESGSIEGYRSRRSRPGFSVRCGIVNACRVAVLPSSWWCVMGFGESSGVQFLKERLGLSTVGASALAAFLLAAISVGAMLPCKTGEGTTEELEET